MANDIVEPDLLFDSRDRLNILKGPYLEGAPDLVVEILSPSTRRRDLGKKKVRYEELGVQEYWTLDPDRKPSRSFAGGARASGRPSSSRPTPKIS